MFDIKGLRTFAMSAKDLDKSVEFYTKTLGGQIVKKVEPTDEQKKAGQVKEVDVRLGDSKCICSMRRSNRAKSTRITR